MHTLKSMCSPRQLRFHFPELKSVLLWSAEEMIPFQAFIKCGQEDFCDCFREPGSVLIYDDTARCLTLNLFSCKSLCLYVMNRFPSGAQSESAGLEVSGQQGSYLII